MAAFFEPGQEDYPAAKLSPKRQSTQSQPNLNLCPHVDPIAWAIKKDLEPIAPSPSSLHGSRCVQPRELSCPVRTRKIVRDRPKSTQSGLIDADFDAVGTIPSDLLPLVEIWNRLPEDDRQAVLALAKRLGAQ